MDGSSSYPLPLQRSTRLTLLLLLFFPLHPFRWDYIFSYIKKTRMHKKHVLPDRSEVTMTVPFMDAYVRLLIQTCHKRKVAAMGGSEYAISTWKEANETTFCPR